MQPLRILRILRAAKISACSALRQVFLLSHKLSLIISVSIRDHPWANTLTQMIDSHTDLTNLTDSRIVNSRVSSLRRVLPFRRNEAFRGLTKCQAVPSEGPTRYDSVGCAD